MMRKKKIDIEQNRQAQIEHEARIRQALRWTDGGDINPDVPPPDAGNKLTTGYTFIVYSRRVDIACSSPVAHAIGRTDKTTSQHPLSLYSTRERALRALRVALERECADALAKIDAQLEGQGE